MAMTIPMQPKRERHLRLASWFAVALAAANVYAAEEPTSDHELAYVAVTHGYWQVWVSRADGSKARQVTKTRTDKTRLSWFPDSKRLLVNLNDGTVAQLDIETGIETRISLDQSPVVDAVVSPDGSRLAFSFSTAIDGNDLWVTGVDGRSAQKLVRMASLQHEPTWSPDGKSLYFLSGDGGQAHDIWRIRLHDGSTEQQTVGTLYHFDVAVSSDGMLAYSSNRGGDYDIYLQRAGATTEQLTDDPALDGGPTFAPDGSAIVFESTRGGVLNLWRLDLSSRTLKQITNHPEGARAAAWYSNRKIGP